MVIPYSTAQKFPLVTDEHVQSRVRDLVGDAIRRQLWLMFLDQRGVQLPVLLPTDIAERPRPTDAAPFSAFVAQAVEATQCSACVIVLERPGPDAIGADDRAWLELVATAVRASGTVLRGPLLSHSGGIRWIAADDLG